MTAPFATRQADPLLDSENPWPGLGAFSEASTRFFHGRGSEAAELFRRVKRDSLTVLFGQSGLGKTSLLQAGLFPMLREDDYLPVYVRRLFADSPVPLEEQIWRQLEAECELHGVEAPSRGETASLWEYLHQAETAFWSERNRPITPVIVLDQFEDLFTIARERLNDQTRAAFVAALGDLAANRVPKSLLTRLNQNPGEASRFDVQREPCRLIVSIREDYLPELESERFQGVLAASTQNRMRIEPMRSAQALDAVLKTGGKLVDEQTANDIVSFLAGVESNSPQKREGLTGEEIEPAILSVFCSGRNKKRQLLHRENIGPDLVQGSKHEILRDFYDDALSDLDSGVKTFIEEKLVTQSGYRNSRPLEEALREPGVTADALEKLVDRRVLRREERFHAMQVELTHDKLTQVATQSRDKRRRTEQLRRSRSKFLMVAAVAAAMIVIAAAAVIIAVKESNLRRSVNNVAYDLATDYEVGRGNIKQDLATASGFYSTSCKAANRDGCESEININWLINAEPSSNPRLIPSAINGEYTLCQVDSLPLRDTVRLVTAPATIEITDAASDGDGISFKVRPTQDQAGAWLGNGRFIGSHGAYDWASQADQSLFGKTLLVFAPDGTLYGHEVPLNRPDKWRKSWWFFGRKPGNLKCP